MWNWKIKKWKREKKKFKKDKIEKKQQNETIIKDKIIRDIRTLFKQKEKEDYYKPKRVSNSWNNNNIEYESNGDRKRNFSPDQYLSKIEPCLRNIINNLQNSNAWKIQLIIVINFISSKDSEEDRVMHSSSDNIKSTFHSEVNDVIEKLFKSLRSKYWDCLEISMKRSHFIFDPV